MFRQFLEPLGAILYIDLIKTQHRQWKCECTDVYYISIKRFSGTVEEQHNSANQSFGKTRKADKARTAKINQM